MDLICTTSEGHDSIVYLQDQWADSKCDPGARIRLIGAKKWGDLDWLVSNDNGILITSPDTLVRCTSIASSSWCARKVRF
uniref:Dna2 domain-containing protein n=1 Tax=Heterorhabditis bacteriophora TaxID=37862 RepID=A0A1I7XQ93_HETBA